MPTYTILIPRWRPPRANQFRGRHWSAEAKLKRQAAEMIGTYARLAGVPLAAGTRRVSLLVRLAPRAKPADRDAYDKVLLDVLVSLGLLRDDDAKGLVGRVAVEHVPFAAGPLSDWGTKITLDDD